MVYAKTLLSYPDWKLPLTVNTDDSDKQLGAVINQNNKPIVFFSSKLSKPQSNYNTIEKELLVIVECLKKPRQIIFGYEINVFYATNLSESQRVMRCRLIIKEFGPNIQHIAGVHNIVSVTISRLMFTPSDKNETCTRKAKCRINKLFTIGREEKNENCFLLNLLIVQREQQ